MPNTNTATKKGRHLVLIDIENLTSTPSPTREEVEMVTIALRDVVHGFDQAQRIVACSHHAAPAVAFAFPPARHLWRSGRDGADRALLDVLENERVDERFACVTICSGDGIFAAMAASLALADVEVTVVSLEGQLAARLELAARDVVLLRPTTRLISTGSAS
jgi:hypothetical protein